MKLLIILCCSTLFAVTSNFDVQGMMCGVGCANKIKTHVKLKKKFLSLIMSLRFFNWLYFLIIIITGIEKIKYNI